LAAGQEEQDRHRELRELQAAFLQAGRAVAGWQDEGVPPDAEGIPEIVAATDYKQRIRMTLEYFPCRAASTVPSSVSCNGYDQGLFVKNGAGSADVKPIAHLYKAQVHGMAR
jgi:NH3-dependent NAD+ synthetase